MFAQELAPLCNHPVWKSRKLTMGTIFQSISAEFSSDFEIYMSNEKAKTFLERVCDITGTLLISSSNNDVHTPSSLKICGSWDSMLNAHNILSAYSVVNDLMKTEDVHEQKSLSPKIEVTKANPSSLNARRKRKTPPCPRSKRPDSMFFKHQDETKSTSKFPAVYPSEHLQIDPDSNPDFSESPIPVAITNLQNNQSEPIVFQQNSMESTGQLVTSDGADMYFVNNDSTQESLGSTPEKPIIPVEGIKGQYSCSMCKYTTNSARNLESHIDRFHLKPVTCHKCGKGFGYERDLKRHLLKNKYSCLGRSVVNKHYISVLPEGSIGEVNQEENSPKNSTLLKENDSESLSDFRNQNLAIKVKEEPVFDDENTADYEINNSTVSAGDSSTSVKSATFIPTKPDSLGEKDNSVQNEEFTEHQEMRSMYMEADSDTQNDFSNDFTTSSTPGDLVKFNCHSCPYVAQKKQHIIDHICRMHKKQFACDYCNSKFGLIKDLNRHLRRSHGIDIPLKNSRGMNMTF